MYLVSYCHRFFRCELFTKSMHFNAKNCKTNGSEALRKISVPTQSSKSYKFFHISVRYRSKMFHKICQTWKVSPIENLGADKSSKYDHSVIEQFWHKFLYLVIVTYAVYRPIISTFMKYSKFLDIFDLIFLIIL